MSDSDIFHTWFTRFGEPTLTDTSVGMALMNVNERFLKTINENLDELQVVGSTSDDHIWLLGIVLDENNDPCATLITRRTRVDG